jgi:putative thioredoxin
METLIGAAKAGEGKPGELPAGLIKDSDTKSFMADVIEASQQVPVIVDFWAPWCGPCKQLGPSLEKAVLAAKGAVRLVKVDIDQNPQLATQMRIQSIPAVYAFFQGRPVDGFVGALPDSQVKTFVSKLAEMAGGGAANGDGAIAEALAEAEASLEAGDAGTASALFNQILAHEPGHPAATAGILRCLVAAGELTRAKELLAKMPAQMQADPAIVKVKAAVELAEQSAGAVGQLAELQAKVELNANDHQSRFDLAMALYATGRQDTAVDELLEIFKRDKAWNDEAARKQLVKFFEALGPTHELTVSGRRKLSSLMFR